MAMMRFLSIGECMVEMAPQTQAGQFQIGFAGDTLNTAWYVRRMCPDWDVQYLTVVGEDATSQQLSDFLASAGVGTAHVQVQAHRMLGLYLITLDQGERHFSYWRGQSAARLLAADRAVLDAAFAKADLLYFSGITLAIQEGNGRANLLDALAAARSAGCKVAFDSNLRPKLWGSKDEMCDWVSKAAAISDIVLPSHDDEAVYFGDRDPLATRDRYAASGARTVVVKNGPGEIHYSHQGTMGALTPRPIPKIVDTTAAGDSFNAGFFGRFFQDGDIAAAITAGSDLAGQVVQGRGALVDL